MDRVLDFGPGFMAGGVGFCRVSFRIPDCWSKASQFFRRQVKRFTLLEFIPYLSLFFIIPRMLKTLSEGPDVGCVEA